LTDLGNLNVAKVDHLEASGEGLMEGKGKGGVRDTGKKEGTWGGV
jgi:hypothetical protein